MQNAPLLSVIMPVYNAEKYLSDAVKSVISQTYENIELICVNDSSKDNSLSLLNDLAKTDERIVVVDSPINVGAGQARNLGIAQAQGEYITFVDADDTVKEDLYEKAMNELLLYQADEVVWGLVEEHFDKNNNKIKSVPVVPERTNAKTEDEIVKTVLSLEENTLFGYQCNSIYKASIIKENDICFEKSILYEDYFFNLEFAKKMQSICTLDYAGYVYFKRINGSITHSFTKDYFSLSYRRINSMYEYCLEHGFSEDNLFDVLGNRLLRYTFSALSRNNDKKAEMSFTDKKEWVKSTVSLEMYEALLSRCHANGIAHKVLAFAIKKRSLSLILLLGKLVNILH